MGLEIPLLMRILKERFQFRELVANVLTFDYLGALGASLLFPLVLVPKLGLVRSAVLFGLVNAGVALWSTFLFQEHLPRPAWTRGACLAVVLALCGGLAGANCITDTADAALYADEVILARTTPYQRHRPHPLEGRLSASSSIRTSSSVPATSTAITKRWCILALSSVAARAPRAGAAAAATDWRCAKC